MKVIKPFNTKSIKMSLTSLGTFFLFIKLRFLLNILFIIGILPNVIAQSFEEDVLDALESKPKLDLRLDSRHSFINQGGVSVFGIKGGIEYDRKLRFGLGFNILTTRQSRTVNYIENGQQKKDENARLVFYNFSPYVEYVFFKQKKWEISVPVQIGFGTSYYNYYTLSGKQEDSRKFVLTYEPAITAQYTLLKYFGPGLGIGYRLMIVDNKAIEESFNSPVYIFRMKVFFGVIYDDLFK